MPRQMIATLLTDFGTRDPYAAAMKGVLLGVCPDARIIDISHDVEPHDIQGAAFVLAQAAPCFPPGTVHVVVVDPGVGTSREILAARLGGQYFVFPDNGVITFVQEVLPMEEIAIVRDRRFFRTDAPSATFHGRDILAPVAGHILRGLDIRRLGQRPQTYKLLDLPAVREEPDELLGEVRYVDRFGNLVTNITAAMIRRRWDAPERSRVRCGQRDIGPLRGAYAAGEAGEPLAVVNSMGLLEIAVREGRAADVLQAGLRTAVRVVGT